MEQGSTVLAEPNDNFRYARRMVGQQLLAFIMHDMLGKSTAAVKRGTSQKLVDFNRQVMTVSGPVIENDIETAQVKVVLEDIPATPVSGTAAAGPCADGTGGTSGLSSGYVSRHAGIVRCPESA